jgi:hypothetical protein
MRDVCPTCIRIMELVGTAFVCGVVFFVIWIVIFDTTGIDRMLGELMWVSLIVLPVAASVVISYFCHLKTAYAAATGAATLVFAAIVLRMVSIGHAF